MHPSAFGEIIDTAFLGSDKLIECNTGNNLPVLYLKHLSLPNYIIRSMLISTLHVETASKEGEQI